MSTTTTSTSHLYVVAGYILVLADTPRQAVERSGLPPAYIPHGLKTVKLAEGPLFRKGWYSGTTPSRFARLGTHAAINVRAGEFWRNQGRGDDHRIDRRNARHALARIDQQQR